MTLKISNSFIKDFVSADEVEALAHEASYALSLVKNKNGCGSDFLGWYDLPQNYDREEFERIKLAAKKYRKTPIFSWLSV